MSAVIILQFECACGVHMCVLCVCMCLGMGVQRYVLEKQGEPFGS